MIPTFVFHRPWASPALGFFILAAVLLLSHCPVQADETLEKRLEVQVALAPPYYLRQHITEATLKVFNPVYQKEMTYKGFWLDEILKLEKVKVGDRDIVFHASDGYTTALAAGELGRRRWLLAYGEANGSWTPLPNRKTVVSPAPWYLVGTSSESFKSFEWPFQLTAVTVRPSF
jgi:hypothetical protein